LIPWVIALMGTALNTDHAWLLITAERLLDGGDHLHDFFQPNPPLSILLYVPDVVLARVAGIPVYYTPYIIGLLAQAASSLAVYFLLKKCTALDASTLLVFTGAYVLAGTYLVSTIYFAERDEFVVWGLVPFLIAQLAI